jgi:hypothetical protein
MSSLAQNSPSWTAGGSLRFLSEAPQAVRAHVEVAVREGFTAELPPGGGGRQAAEFPALSREQWLSTLVDGQRGLCSNGGVETGAESCGRRKDVVEEVELDLVGEVAVVHLRVGFASLALPNEAFALWALEELVELVGLGV